MAEPSDGAHFVREHITGILHEFGIHFQKFAEVVHFPACWEVYSCYNYVMDIYSWKSH